MFFVVVLLLLLIRNLFKVVFYIVSCWLILLHFFSFFSDKVNR